MAKDGRQVALGAVLTGTGGPGAYNTWHDPEIPGNAGGLPRLPDNGRRPVLKPGPSSFP